MSEKKKGKSLVKKVISVYATYKGELVKIVWPGRPELIRKTITVAVVSGLFGAYISILDGLLGAAFTTFVGFLN